MRTMCVTGGVMLRIRRGGAGCDWRTYPWTLVTMLVVDASSTRTGDETTTRLTQQDRHFLDDGTDFQETMLSHYTLHN